MRLAAELGCLAWAQKIAVQSALQGLVDLFSEAEARIIHDGALISERAEVM